jgi:regulator of sirC expression with transglutaminase-like and TPR domain
MTKIEARARFAALASQHENEIELDRAALLIAAEEYPALEVETYLRRLDDLAAQAQASVAGATDALTRAQVLSDFLASDLKFNGNREKYFDARNSFLNEVLDRRTGIPITLSVVYLEIARRLGIRLYGVGMPGHFLIKSVEADQEIFIDPFHAGRLLTQDNCREMIEELYGGRLRFQPEFLAAVTKRQILTRMLQNLKGIYSGLRDYPKTLAAIERLLLLNPGDSAEIRDRGGVYQAMGRYAESLADLQDYLRRQPQAEDAEKIKEMIQQTRQRQARNN